MVGGTGRVLFSIVGVALLAFGCARSQRSATGLEVSQLSSGSVGYSSYSEAGRETYRYAFSGQILDETTKVPVPKFSVELVGDDPAIATILNSLGDERGLFHISRTAATETMQFATVPVIISASGYEPFVQMVDLGSDCLNVGCPEVRPTPFLLKPVPATQSPNRPLSAKKIQEIITQKGIPGLFRDLINLGKWDAKTRVELSQARNAELLTNVVIFLKVPDRRSVIADLNAIFKDGEERRLSKIPVTWTGRSHEVVEIAREHREVASSLLAVGELLPYLNGIAPKLSVGEGGPLAGLVHRFLSEKDTEAQLAAMVMKSKAETKSELAMASLMPLLQGWISKGNSSTAYEGFLNRALSETTNMEWLSSDSFRSTDDDISLFIKYLQPLAQAFVGKQGVILMRDFNRLIAGEGLKNLHAFDGARAEFMALAPYVIPLVRGLGSQDAKRLTRALYPILQRKDPALVIRNIIVRMDTMESEKRSRVIATLFPAAGDWAQQAVPAKQILASQILAGLYFGDFKEVHVTQDLLGGRAVVVSAQARDIFKLTMLPNVEKILILKDR